MTFKDLPVAEAVVKHKELFLDGRRLDPKPSVSRCEQDFRQPGFVPLRALCSAI